MKKISRSDIIEEIKRELGSQEAVNDLKTLLEIRRGQSGKYGCILMAEPDLFDAIMSTQIKGMVFVTAETLETFRKALLEGTINIIIPSDFKQIPRHSYLKSFLEENYVFFEFLVIFLRESRQITSINKLLKFSHQENNWLDKDFMIEYKDLSDLLRILNTCRILDGKGIRVDSSLNFEKKWLGDEISRSISLLIGEKITKIASVPYAIIRETYHAFVQQVDGLSYLNPNFTAISSFGNRDKIAESLAREIISSLEGKEMEMTEIKKMIIRKIQSEFGPFLFEDELVQFMNCSAIRIPAILETRLKERSVRSEDSPLSKYLNYIWKRKELKRSIDPEILESLGIAITGRQAIYEAELRQIMIISLYKQIFEDRIIPVENLFHAAFFSSSDSAYFLIFSSKLDIEIKKNLYCFTYCHYRIRNDYRKNLHVLRYALEKEISPIYFYLLELEIMNVKCAERNYQLYDRKSVWEFLDPSSKNIFVIMDNLSFFDVQDKIQHEIELLQSFIPTITPMCCSSILFDLDEDSYITSKDFFYPLGERKFEVIKSLTPRNVCKIDHYLKMSDIKGKIENLHIYNKEFKDPVLYHHYQEVIASEHETSILTLIFSAVGKSIFSDTTLNKSFENAIGQFIQIEKNLLLVYFPEDNKKIDHLEFREFDDIDLKRHQELVTQEKIMRILDVVKDYNLKNLRIIITTDHGSVPLLYRSDRQLYDKTKEFFCEIFSGAALEGRELSSSQIVDFDEIDYVYALDERGLFIYSTDYQVLTDLTSILETSDREFDIEEIGFGIRDILSIEKKTIKGNLINKIYMLFYPTKDWICLNEKKEKIVVRTHGGASLFEIIIPGVVLGGNL